MKKLKHLLCLVLCLCALTVLMTVSASAATEVTSLDLAVVEPAFGAPLSTAADIWVNSSFEIVDVDWFANGIATTDTTVQADKLYAVKIDVKIKDGQDKVFGNIDQWSLKINGKAMDDKYQHSVTPDGILRVYKMFQYTFNANGKKTTVGTLNKGACTIPAPMVGDKPAAGSQGMGDQWLTVSDLKWSGKLDASGCFQAGQQYTATVVLKFKPDVTGGIFRHILAAENFTVNGQKAATAEVRNNYTEAWLTYTFPATKDAGSITEQNNTRVNLTAPKTGALPTFGEVPADWNSYVKTCQWVGELDQYGRFQPGTQYSVNITVRVKPTSPNFVFKAGTTSVVNNSAAVIKSISKDGKEMVLTYTFPATSSTPVAAPTGTPVEDFAPGDYGVMTGKSGTVVYYKTTDPLSDEHYRWEAAKNHPTIIVLHAYVTENYHAVLCDGQLAYLEIGKFTTYENFVKYGTGTYSGQESEDQIVNTMIKELRAPFLTAEPGKAPSVELGENENVVVESITYSSDTVQPGQFFSATITYKPAPGYVFHENIGMRQYIRKNDRNGYELKFVDLNTVQFINTVWVDYPQVKASQFWTDYMRMLSFKREHFDQPCIATATVYDPVAEFFLDQYLNGDFDHVDQSTFQLFYDNYVNSWIWTQSVPQRITYQESYKTLDGKLARVHHGETVKVIDLDVSDTFPGLTEEWCLISAGAEVGYIERARLTNIDTTVNEVQVCPGNVVDTLYQFAGGTGTKTDPYLIANADQLNAIRVYPSPGGYKIETYYKLIADIDLSGWGNWVPIGGTEAYGGWPSNVSKGHGSSRVFLGHLDGNGHTISGMTIRIDTDLPVYNDELYFGLFAATTSAVIENLTMKDYVIDVAYRAATKNLTIYAGAFAALPTTSTFKNCTSTGGSIRIQCQAAEGKQITFYPVVGGIAGESRDSTFTGCKNTSDITVRCTPLDDNANFLGVPTVQGITYKGFGADTTSITKCTNTGKITLIDAAPEAPTSKFSDVITSKYYYEPVVWAVGKVITNGTTETTFEPNATCNRGQILTMLWRAAGKPAPTIANPYTDVPAGRSITEAAIWAYEKGIITSTTFDRYAPCTRGDAVTYIWKSFGAPEPSAEAVKNASVFTDVPAGTELAKAVAWAVERGVTNGKSATTFVPAENCTRAHIIAFLHRGMGTDRPEWKLI